MSNNKTEYLGDGLYATFDGWQVELRSGAHDNPIVVYIEPAVLARLNCYMARMQNEQAKVQPPPESGSEAEPDSEDTNPPGSL